MFVQNAGMYLLHEVIIIRAEGKLADRREWGMGIPVWDCSWNILCSDAKFVD
jgi:hypothetical protein